MAIIYSYPDNLNILLTDMLIGTSTVRVAGKKKNITKNFTVEALGKVISEDNPAVWGTIIGDLADQTDLQLALDSKQDNIILTTTGLSGPATLVDSVLNIPIYSGGSFVFQQVVPALIWDINHNLDKFPSVSIVNINNIVIYGDITYIDSNNIRLSFSAGFAGKAYLN
jgi:hypothetical protein